MATRRKIRRAVRRAKSAIVLAPARAVRRVRSGVAAARQTIVEVRRSPRAAARRAAIGLARGAGAIAIGQARILPAAVGGFAAGIVERNQREKHAAMIRGGQTSGGAIIKDPTMRLAAQLGIAAYAASKTQGMAREALCGYAGGVGALYELYRYKAPAGAESGSNPADGYLDGVKAGESGL